MNIDQLLTFIKLSDKLNYSKTAYDLNVTQPTITARIKTLEEELDCELFNIEGKRVSLTEAGRLFLVYANNILNLYNEAKSAIKQLKHPKLIVGFPPNFSTKRIVKALDSIDVTEIQLTIYRGVDSNDLLKRILDNTITLAFVHGNVDHEQLYEEKISNIDLKLVVSCKHHLAKSSVIEKQHLYNETLICYTRHTKLWSAIDEELKNIPLQRIEVNDVDTVKKLVKEGIGFTVLPETSIDEDEREEFCILTVRDFYDNRKVRNIHLYAIYKKTLRKNEKVVGYIDTIIHNMKLACSNLFC